MTQSKSAYGVGDPSIDVFPAPQILEAVPPSTNKSFQIGQKIYIRQTPTSATEYTYQGGGTWAATGGGSGSFTTVSATTGNITTVNSTTTNSTTVNATTVNASGNLVATTAGGGLQIKEGSNARMGVSTLVAGTVTVANTSVTANTRIILSRYSAGASTAVGTLSVGTVTANTSFVINSLDPTDATVETSDISVIDWVLIEAAP